MSEYTRETHLEHVKAFWDGKLEFRSIIADAWVKAQFPPPPGPMTDYRIKPETKWRPWTNDEVPLGALIRMKDWDHGARGLICSVDISGRISSGTWTFRHEDLVRCEHSIDGGKTWLPCGVEESK